MSKTAYTGGFSLSTVVGIVLVVLKLANVEPVATWSWWWVTCPFWFGFAAIALIIVVFIVLSLLCAALSDK